MSNDQNQTTTPEPWPVHFEDLRGGRYWCIRVPGMDETIDIHEDDGGEVLARRIANLPVLEVAHGKQS